MDKRSDIYFVQAVSNGQENSKPCQPASCQDTTAAVTPDARETARAHSSQLAALILLLLLIIIILLVNHIFEGLDILGNSRNLAVHQKW